MRYAHANDCACRVRRTALRPVSVIGSCRSLGSSCRDAPEWTGKHRVVPPLRQTGDNTTRSFIIRDLARVGVNPDIVVQRLRSESDVGARRGLLLALGGYRIGLISTAERESLIRLLREWHESDPDSGIHSASQWLLREHGHSATRPSLKGRAG